MSLVAACPAPERRRWHDANAPAGGHPRPGNVATVSGRNAGGGAIRARSPHDGDTPDGSLNGDAPQGAVVSPAKGPPRLGGPGRQGPVLGSCPTCHSPATPTGTVASGDPPPGTHARETPGGGWDRMGGTDPPRDTSCPHWTLSGRLSDVTFNTCAVVVPQFRAVHPANGLPWGPPVRARVGGVPRCGEQVGAVVHVPGGGGVPTRQGRPG